MDDRPKLIVTPDQLSRGWIVFGGFHEGRVVTHHFPMREIGRTKEGNSVVLDEPRRGRVVR